MKKIAFLIEQEVSVLCSELESKACSGTIYSTLLLADELSKSDKYKVYLFHKGPSEVKGDIEYIGFYNYQDVYSSLKVITPDVFIVSGNNASIFTDLHPDYNIPQRVFWLHNHIDLKNINNLVRNRHITDVVTVCAYQMGWAFKYGMFWHTRYIYNPYRKIKTIPQTKNEKLDELRLCFIGALVPEKGILNLFKVFNSLRNRGVNVRLDIFGSSGLYGDNVELGVTRALSTQLECQFREHIFDKCNQLKKGIIFHGSVSKLDIIAGISNSDVFLSGLNEVGPAECFSISFLDAQSVGIPVYTLRRGGQPESIMPFSGGKVFNNINSLINQIELDFNAGEYHQKKSASLCMLSPDVIANEWDALFFGESPSCAKRFFSLLSLIRVLFSLFFNGYFKN